MNTLKKIIQLVLVILTLSPLNAFCQISYLEDKELIFPETEYDGFIPMDILHTNNKIYVYTYQKILIFSENMDYHGDIDFGNELGKFAPVFYSDNHYSTDVKFMTVDENLNELYYVTPSFQVKKVSTDIVDPTPQDIDLILNKPNGLGDVSVSNLVGFSKIEYAVGKNNQSDRLIWFLRFISDNNHSFGSFVGIYTKNSGWTETIYDELLDGSVGYTDLVSNVIYNPTNEDFYLTRKFKIELHKVVQGEWQQSELKTFQTNQERNGKLLFVQNNGVDLLVVFPHWVSYDLESENHSIYQVNTQTRQLVSTLLSPSKRILDAIYSESNEDILMCFADDNAVQFQPSGYDVAWMHFNSLTNRFYFDKSSEDKYLLSTQASNEVDINPYKNYNVGFKFLELSSNNILLSKKNEIVRLEKNGFSYFSTNEKYSRDSNFYKGVNTSNAAFIISQTSGIQKITSTFGSPLTKTINPVYNTESNPFNRKLYFFNRLSTDNTGFYVYDLDTESIETFIETPYPIGDLKYNKFQNHILVTQYCESSMGTPSIRVYNAETNDYIGDNNIIPVNGNYPSRMLVAPNGYIYYSSDTKYDSDNPKINIVNASTYSIPKDGEGDNIVIEVNMNYVPSIDKYNYTSFFSYNPYNNTVYATFSPYSCLFPPYQSSFHSTIKPNYDQYMNIETSEGKLISIDENFTTSEYNGNSLGEIVCAIPLIEPTDNDYKGKLYINGTNLYTFDCKTNSLTKLTEASNLYDIDYNPVNNCIYGLRNFLHKQPGQPDINIIHVLKVNEVSEITYILSEFDGNYGNDYHGIGSSLSYNKFDDQLYLYYLSDEILLGGSPAKVLTLDPYSEVADHDVTITDSVYLPYRHFFPEITPQANFPYFDAYNKAYFPNGFNSSVSVIEFTPKEVLPLVFGENKDLWMSVPRLENNMTDEYDEGDYVETVFDKGRFGIPYSTFDLKYENPENDVIEKASWYPLTEWEHDQEDNIFSYRGYIMELNSLEDNYLYMYGQIKDPATLFPIYPQKTNPIGYFLPQEQDVFDALGTTTLSLIDEIRSQNYYCEKQEGIIPYGPTGGNVGEIESYYWVCDKHQTNINYGDMIMVRSSQTGTEADEIQWQNGPGVVREKIRPKTEYFAYEQVNNYTPFIIELNYDVNPLELGAFINNKCVGATALMSEDSIVFMRVYLDGADPDSIVFQDWNGTKSSGNGIIREYKVFNELTKTFENRILKGNIGTNKVRISFKNANDDSNNDNEINNNSFMIWPNPANNKLFFSIQIDESTLSKIELLDISGRKIDLIYSGLLKEGYNSGNINLSNLSIEAGIYFVKIKAGSLIQTKKLIINK